MKNLLLSTSSFLIVLGVGFVLPAYAKDVAPTVITASDTTKAEKVFNAKSIILDNGMQVVVVENHRAPVITHMVWYKVGAADEPAGKSGIAHFLEHLLFKGQRSKEFGDIPPGEFSKIIRAMGGQDNAFTSQDYTAYFQSVASEHLETVMQMEAGRMHGLDVPKEEFESENKVILEERRQRTDNDPRAQMAEQLDQILFPNHPYGTPVIGWLHEMARLSWEDAKGFYDKYYAPNNAILVVSGDVEAEKVFDLARKTYGILERRETPVRNRTVSPPFHANPVLTLEHATIQEPSYIRVARVPGYRNDPKISLAFQIIEEIMSGGSSSRLYKTLVVEEKVATSISMSYQSAVWDDSTIEITATPSPEKTVEDVRAAIADELRKLIRDGITDQERTDAIKRMKAQAIYARDSLSGPAMIIGYSLSTGASLDDIENWPNLLETVTKENIQDAAKQYLDPDKVTDKPFVEGYLLPQKSDAEKQ